MAFRLSRILVLLLLLLPMRGFAAEPDLARQSPAKVTEQFIASVTSGNIEPVSSWLTPDAIAALARLVDAERQSHALQKIGPVLTTQVSSRTERQTGTELIVKATHQAGISQWAFAFRDQDDRIDSVSFVVTATPTVIQSERNWRWRDILAQMGRQPSFQGQIASAFPNFNEGAVANAFPNFNSFDRGEEAFPEAPPAIPSRPPAPPAPAVPPTVALDAALPPPDARTVDFLLATTRKIEVMAAAVRFSPDRSPTMHYGMVRVHVPEQGEHTAGHVELPKKLGLLGWTFYEEKLDEKKHFVIKYARLITEAQFYDTMAGSWDKEALIFVHGFNNSFEDSAYRFAQILFDLQYKKPAVLFSWASKGSTADYLYDKDSALIARDSFITLLRSLKARGVEKIHVIAHSMGNLVVIDALANAADSALPDHVAQLIMAAPDVGRDYFTQMEPKLARIADGMTLYACATDRALLLAKTVGGGVSRAGDVPAEGPIVMTGLDTIDVSALGQDWFGLNHDVFATNRSVIDDMFQLLNTGKHPPRLAQIRGMPDGTTPPTFWRFQP